MALVGADEVVGGVCVWMCDGRGRRWSGIGRVRGWRGIRSGRSNGGCVDEREALFFVGGDDGFDFIEGCFEGADVAAVELRGLVSLVLSRRSRSICMSV